MSLTKIQWTERVWNPIRGCSKVSEGCKHCYAKRMAARFCGEGQPYHGLIRNGKWTGEARFIPEMITAPLRWKKPSLVFVNSMSDLFHESLSFGQIDAIFGTMWACLFIGKDAVDGHTFQILTKRAPRMLEYFSIDRRENWATHAVHVGGGSDPDSVYDQVRYFDGPHPRIHLGVSVENQRAADERIPLLLKCQAAVRWVSAEPLLGHVEADLNGIDWVVTGGESGPDARPMHPDWARSLRDQCKTAGVPFFFKQWGEWNVASEENGCTGSIMPESGERYTWIGADGRTQNPSFHGLIDPVYAMQRIGKRRAGNLLDGVRHEMRPGEKWT